MWWILLIVLAVLIAAGVAWYAWYAWYALPKSVERQAEEAHAQCSQLVDSLQKLGDASAKRCLVLKQDPDLQQRLPLAVEMCNLVKDALSSATECGYKLHLASLNQT